MQYACGAYSERLETRGIDAGMSRVANPYDNAKAGSFMKTLKAEEVDGKAYADIQDAHRNIGGFIDRVYNADRLHSALGYKSPVAFEAELGKSDAANKTMTTGLVNELACLTHGVQSRGALHSAAVLKK